MIILTGGGTGGHLNIVRCLLEASVSLGLECVYIGSENGQDRAWFENEPKFGAKYFLNSSGVVNKGALGRFKSLANILKLSLRCREIFKKHDAKLVFSVGGYSAAPASFAALISHLPLFIHEQNSKSGSLNMLLKPFAKGFYTSFSSKNIPYPVKDEFFKLARVRTNLKKIIFLGGSQGASFINDLALNLALNLNERGVEIIHQCGAKDYEKCKAKYDELGIRADLFDFSSNLAAKMNEADLAISRAGASTLFELMANCLPSIFVPYPFAAKNHQFFNAFWLKNQNLAELFLQQNLNEAELLKSIFKLNLEYISENLQGKAQKNAGEFIISSALNKIKK